ncbi:MAG: NAD(+) diphosphatase [Clostridiales bacterium]|nr:NAD(+) diphosphatase [Clostridiales bacterium]
MLQDLAYGRLENEFKKNMKPVGADRVVCVQDGSILIKREADDTLSLPTCQEVTGWATENRWPCWGETPFQYVFRMQDEDYYIWMGNAGSCSDEAYRYELTGSLRQITSKDICYAAMTAWHLFNWYKNSRFCGACGTATVHDENERMMRCPSCGNMIFPRINPSVIIALTDGDKLLLSKYAGRAYTRYALLAGFMEIGETAEQCVAREVMEEVGLKVKNVRYYKTQPWGIAGNILMGFYCDLDGDNTITLDETELAMADWYHRDNLPAWDDGISLTREMIRVFGEGNEPK